MAASTPVTKSRNRIKAILDGVSGLSAGRISVGNVDLAANNTFLTTLTSAGPYVNISRAKFKQRDVSASGLMEFDVLVHFWFAYPDDQAQDFIAIEDVLTTAVQAVMNKANWVGIDAMFPVRGGELDEEEEPGKPRKLHYTLTIGFGKAD